MYVDKMMANITPIARQQLRQLGIRLKNIEDRERKIYKTMTALVRASKENPELVEKWVKKRVPTAKLLIPTPPFPTPPSFVSWVKDKVGKVYKKTKEAFTKAKNFIKDSARKVVAGAKWFSSKAAKALGNVFNVMTKPIRSSIDWLKKRAIAGKKYFDTRIKNLKERLKTASPEEIPYIKQQIKELENAEIASEALSEYPQAVAQEAALLAEEKSEALGFETLRFKNIIPLILIGALVLGIGLYYYGKRK